MSGSSWPLPANIEKAEGGPRHVGVEFELLGLKVLELARVTADVVDGKVQRVSEAEYSIETPHHGAYRVEVDYALLKDMAKEQESQGHEDVSQFDKLALDVLAAASSLVVPCEVVTPPIPMSELAQPMDALNTAIRRAGGKGTLHSPFYAFGLHLNIEPPDMDAETVAAHLKAFVCLFDWLVWQGEVDLSRRATPYISRYPTDYEAHIIDPDYWPSWQSLIDDYLKWNATRNRALDMLPMFAHVDESTVRGHVDDDRVQARPAFHYRLANCNIDDPDWSIAAPWTRWMQIEHLAGNRDKLNECCAALQDDRDRALHGLDNQWRETVGQWLQKF